MCSRAHVPTHASTPDTCMQATPCILRDASVMPLVCLIHRPHLSTLHEGPLQPRQAWARLTICFAPMTLLAASPARAHKNSEQPVGSTSYQKPNFMTVGHSGALVDTERASTWMCDDVWCDRALPLTCPRHIVAVQHRVDPCVLPPSHGLEGRLASTAIQIRSRISSCGCFSQTGRARAPRGTHRRCRPHRSLSGESAVSIDENHTWTRVDTFLPAPPPLYPPLPPSPSLAITTSARRRYMCVTVHRSCSLRSGFAHSPIARVRPEAKQVGDGRVSLIAAGALNPEVYAPESCGGAVRATRASLRHNASSVKFGVPVRRRSQAAVNRWACSSKQACGCTTR